MVADTRSENARRLIARIEAEAEAQALQIVAEAEEKAAAIIASARTGARQRVGDAVAGLRRDGAAKLARVGAGIETERRKLQQGRDQEIQRAGVAQMAPALAALWEDAASRRAWCDNILKEAKARLTSGAWRIEHPPGLPAAEIAGIVRAAEAHTGSPPETDENPRAPAGLVIHADTARIDGTPAALCRDESRLSALFLGELARLRQEGGR